MDPGDWGSFWEDRGFSGDAEPSDVWVRAFADRAAKLFPGFVRGFEFLGSGCRSRAETIGMGAPIKPPS